MIRLLSLLSFFLTGLHAWGQGGARATLNGYVVDSLSGETVLQATISLGGQRVTTNAYGFFSITLPPATYDLAVTHVGYVPLTMPLNLEQDTQLTFRLLPRSSALAEVVVSGRRRENAVRNTQMGRVDLTIERIRNVPALLGEVDILKTIQLLPGVRNAGEGNAGFYVRGGGPDQNLILLDDAVVYNTGHLFGFFSVFNGDAIKELSLIKGGMPAQYGGRLSSVLDITMKDGNNNRVTGEGGIGLIASRFSLQGPIEKGKSSFILSARRTYIDALIKPFLSDTSNFQGSGYHFYDLNAKFNHRFSDKDRIFLSGYFGRDVFTFNNARLSFRANIPWGNSTATLRWNHVFSRRLFANTSLVYNDYGFSFGAAQNNFEIRLNSGIRDGTAKMDFDWYPRPSHKVRFGAASTYHKFIPNVTTGRQDSVEFKPDSEDRKFALEHGLYLQDDWEVNNRLRIHAGIRFASFSQIGPYTFYNRDPDGNKVDSVRFDRLSPVRTYAGWEPRVSLRYAFNDETSFKASVTRNLQFIHLVTNAGTTLPTDIWVPSTLRVRPQIGWQYAAGLFRNFGGGNWETSLEGYYKRMENQIEYREGYTPGLGEVEEEFVFGRGWSYGSELFINKVRGRFTGWLGYTLSWTWRQFPDLNAGIKFPAKYDRRHDLSLVGNYSLSDRWKLGSVFVYGTGNATSLPERFYIVDGVLTQEYSTINKYRLKPYHRLDISATLYPKPREGRKLNSHWVFSIYNVYSRLNPYFVFYSQTGSPYDGSLEVQAKQVSLFPVLPAVTWNFRF